MAEWNDQGWDQVDAFIKRLQNGWKTTSPADLASFVPDKGDAARRSVLLALVEIHQEQQWRSGEHRLVEDYLDQWPELKDDADAVRGMLEAECRTRLACGSVPTDEELRRRFVDLAERIDLNSLVEEEGREGRPDHYGRYKVLRMIRPGGTATVYEAEDNELDRRVAVKVPAPYLQASAEARELIQREAKAAARLDHPGIVKIYDVGEQPEGSCFLVYEYVEGEPLDELIKAGRVTHGQAAEWAAQIAEAIRYAHSRGFVHRDLKPENVLIDAEGKTHLADFGLAVHESDQRQRAGESSGTREYRPPEQVRGEVQWQDGRSDIWSLGVTLYEMLTGRRPFEGETADELDKEILKRHPKPPTEIDDTVPDELERICLKCLAKPLTERYSNAATLARDLRRWMKPHPARRVMMVLTATVVLATVGILAVVQQKLVAPLPPLDGTVDVLVWNRFDASRRGIGLHDAAALPLRAGDDIRIKAQVNRPTYVYLLWIDAEGTVHPVYPWTPDQWGARPVRESALHRISLPQARNEGWEMKGAAGMETVVMLARDEPLPASVDLAKRLSGLPKLPFQDARSVVWFAEGTPVTGGQDELRAPQFFNVELADPLLRTQEEVRERLGDLFALNRSVSFAYQGE